MTTGFEQALMRQKQSGNIPVIGDIKCKSPKEGDLLQGRDPVAVAALLAQTGAPCLSVVTEGEHFGGSLALLEAVAARTNLPILRKDFIETEEDLRQTRAHGATAVLLMCAVQPEPLLCRLYEQALKLGLEPLVETHTRQELLLVEKLGARLVGINNRNIQQWEQDDGSVDTTDQLAALAPKGALVISESAIATPAQARQAIEAGADAVLVGTAIWQAADTAGFYRALCEGKAEDNG